MAPAVVIQCLPQLEKTITRRDTTGLDECLSSGGRPECELASGRPVCPEYNFREREIETERYERMAARETVRDGLVIPEKGFRTRPSKQQLHRLDEVSRISMGFPHDFFAMNMVRTFAYGGMRELIDA